MRSGLIGQTGEIFAESSEAGEQLAFGITNKATGLGRLAGQILGLVAVILVIASAFFLVDREVAKLRADHYFREIRVARYVHGDIFTTYELYDYLKSEPVRQDAYDQGYGVMLAGWVPQIEEYSLTFRPTAEKRVRSIIADAEEPKTYSELVALGQMHTFLGEGGSQEDLKFAREYLEQASRLAPGLPQIYRFLGKVADLSGDMGEGEKYFQKSLAKLPDSADQRMNAKHRGLVKQERHFVYLGLGNMYARAGEILKAADNYRMALSSIESDHAYGQLAKLYDSDQPEEAINYYKQALSIAPDYSIWPYRIALLYDQLGQKEEAQTYASLALGLNPNNLKYNALAQKLGVNK
jgi:tetratricopeptide (TPR) repeat protein